MLKAYKDAVQIVKEQYYAEEVTQVVGDQAYYDLYTRPENLDTNTIVGIGWLHVSHSNMNNVLDAGGFEILAPLKPNSSIKYCQKWLKTNQSLNYIFTVVVSFLVDIYLQLNTFSNTPLAKDKQYSAEAKHERR
jgi:hypothetical protein